MQINTFYKQTNKQKKPRNQHLALNPILLLLLQNAINDAHSTGRNKVKIPHNANFLLNNSAEKKLQRMRLNIKFQLKWEEILASIRLLLSSTLPHCIPSRFSHFFPSFFALSLLAFFYLVLVVYTYIYIYARGSSTSFFPIIHFCCPLADLYCSILCCRKNVHRMKREQVRGCERESWVCKANGIIESKARLEAEWKKNKNKQLQGTRSGLHVAAINAWNLFSPPNALASSFFAVFK